jgi:integrative and conjugative element protein (TIGR02256 family)
MPFGRGDAMLLVEPQLIERLLRFRQIGSNAPEAGGILMGYRRGPHTHVTDATTPSKRDTQQRFRFHRHATYHQRMATMRWKASGETLGYVGEWHTHPEDHPTPSGIDLHHWREIGAAAARPMVFVIIGRKSCWFGIGVRDQILPVVEAPS